MFLLRLWLQSISTCAHFSHLAKSRSLARSLTRAPHFFLPFLMASARFIVSICFEWVFFLFIAFNTAIEMLKMGKGPFYFMDLWYTQRHCVALLCTVTVFGMRIVCWFDRIIFDSSGCCCCDITIYPHLYAFNKGSARIGQVPRHKRPLFLLLLAVTWW